MPEHKIIFAINIEYLKTLPDNSVDSIVTDAPYGLSAEPNVYEVMKDWVEKGYHEVKAKSGFMGKEWDKFVPQPIFWKEVIRVLKPGGHVLCFFGTRTYDWGVMAMRFAGFEIRDQIQWLYGSGFPKSMDISKAIDKQAGATRKVVGKRMDGRYAYEGTDITGGNLVGGSGPKEIGVITAAETEEAKKWEGWGTALKPACEPIVLARKPISEKTVSDNVIKWGTGCLWIDGCRIEFVSDEDRKEAMEKNQHGKFNSGARENNIYGKDETEREDYNPAGRFPANIILDEVAAELLDEKSGVSKSSGGNGSKFSASNRNTYSNTSLHNIIKEGKNGLGFGDVGGASRFFYIAKPSQEERNRGLYGKFQTRKVGDGRQKDNDTAFQRGKKQRLNTHVTVKPIQLMRYLVRLVTPPKGLCIDPFVGSGTTMIACKLDLYNGIGIDNDQEACDIAEGRLTKWNPDLYKVQTLF